MFCIILAALFTAACGGNEGREDASEHTALDPYTLSDAAAYLPDNLNPHAIQGGEDSLELSLARMIFGSLTERDPESPAGTLKYIGALAEGLPMVSADGLVWTYHLRDGLTFSDGAVIDAHTFEYAMRMLLDPLLAYPAAARYWSEVKIAGARAYAAGEEGAAWEDVGVYAVGRLSLQFVLLEAVPAVVGLEALNLIPVHPGLYEAGMNTGRTATSYAAGSIMNLPYAGAYMPAAYVPGKMMALEKNIYYANAYKYETRRVELHVAETVTDGDVLFAKGTTSRAAVTPENRRLYERKGIVRDTSGQPWFIYINTDSGGNPALADEYLRKALYYGVDREYVTSAVSPAFTPTSSFVPLGAWTGNALRGGLSLYHKQTVPTAFKPADYGYDPAKALEYFDMAYKRLGNKKIVVTLTCFDEAELFGTLGVLLREGWTMLFGADRFQLLLELKPTEEAYAVYECGAYEMGMGSMTYKDYDVWSSMAVWSSYYPGKLDAFYNRKFDELQLRCAFGDLMTDYEGKAAALAELEGMLLDYMPAIPLFQDTKGYVY